MATPSTTAEALEPRATSSDDNYLTHDQGLVSWLLTLDHKRIGIMYLIGVVTSFPTTGVK